MEWSRKGQIVSSIQTHRKIRKTAKGNFTESTLVLTNVSKVDNGTYTCTVTTSQNMGYSNQATATLLVTGIQFYRGKEVKNKKMGKRGNKRAFFQGQICFYVKYVILIIKK